MIFIYKWNSKSSINSKARTSFKFKHFNFRNSAKKTWSPKGFRFFAYLSILDNADTLSLSYILQRTSQLVCYARICSDLVYGLQWAEPLSFKLLKTFPKFFNRYTYLIWKCDCDCTIYSLLNLTESDNFCRKDNLSKCVLCL